MQHSTFLKIKPFCPHQLPEKKLDLNFFLDFCNRSLGVAPSRVEKNIESWLEEDHGAGDVTLTGGFSENAQVYFFIVAKEDFVLCGLPMMQRVFELTSLNSVELFSDYQDGQWVQKGTVVLAGKGPAASILLGERVALNFCAKMSGISKKTKGILDEIKKYCPKLQLLETRKSTPGLRMYEKYAVRLAGARNHRHGLDSGAMLKENHLRSIGYLEPGILKLNQSLPILSLAEVEVTNLDEFRRALHCGADVIMLDNFSFADAKIASEERNLKKPSVKLELSGNLDEKKIEDLVHTGVDYVSMGALIHKAVWVDMSLQIYKD